MESNTTNKISDNFGPVSLPLLRGRKAHTSAGCAHRHAYRHAPFAQCPRILLLLLHFFPPLTSLEPPDTLARQTHRHKQDRHVDTSPAGTRTHLCIGLARCTRVAQQSHTHTHNTRTRAPESRCSQTAAPARRTPTRTGHSPHTPRGRGRASQPRKTSVPPASRDEEGDTESQDRFHEPLRFCRGSERPRRPRGKDPGSQQPPRASQLVPRFPLTVTLCPMHWQSQSSEWPDQGLVPVTDSGEGGGQCTRTRIRLLPCAPASAGMRATPL